MCLAGSPPSWCSPSGAMPCHAMPSSLVNAQIRKPRGRCFPPPPPPRKKGLGYASRVCCCCSLRSGKAIIRGRCPADRSHTARGGQREPASARRRWRRDDGSRTRGSCRGLPSTQEPFLSQLLPSRRGVHAFALLSSRQGQGAQFTPHSASQLALFSSWPAASPPPPPPGDICQNCAWFSFSLFAWCRPSVCGRASTARADPGTAEASARRGERTSPDGGPRPRTCPSSPTSP